MATHEEILCALYDDFYQKHIKTCMAIEDQWNEAAIEVHDPVRRQIAARKEAIGAWHTLEIQLKVDMDTLKKMPFFPNARYNQLMVALVDCYNQLFKYCESRLKVLDGLEQKANGGAYSFADHLKLEEKADKQREAVQKSMLTCNELYAEAFRIPYEKKPKRKFIGSIWHYAISGTIGIALVNRIPVVDLAEKYLNLRAFSQSDFTLICMVASFLLTTFGIMIVHILIGWIVGLFSTHQRTKTTGHNQGDSIQDGEVDDSPPQDGSGLKEDANMSEPKRRRRPKPEEPKHEYIDCTIPFRDSMLHYILSFTFASIYAGNFFFYKPDSYYAYPYIAVNQVRYMALTILLTIVVYLLIDLVCTILIKICKR